jgi:hypothetical protein
MDIFIAMKTSYLTHLHDYRESLYFSFEDEGGRFLRNIRIHVKDYKALQPIRRQPEHLQAYSVNTRDYISLFRLSLSLSFICLWGNYAPLPSQGSVLGKLIGKLVTK